MIAAIDNRSAIDFGEAFAPTTGLASSSQLTISPSFTEKSKTRLCITRILCGLSVI